MSAKPLAPNDRDDEISHKVNIVWFLFAELFPSFRKHVVNSDILFLPSFCPCRLLSLGQEVLQGRSRVLDVDGTILRRIEVLEHADDGFSNGRERRCAEEALAAVIEFDALLLEVHDEADHNTPVKEQAGANQGIRHPAGAARMLLERVLDRQLGLEDGKGPGLLV